MKKDKTKKKKKKKKKERYQQQQRKHVFGSLKYQQCEQSSRWLRGLGLSIEVLVKITSLSYRWLHLKKVEALNNFSRKFFRSSLLKMSPGHNRFIKSDQVLYSLNLRPWKFSKLKILKIGREGSQFSKTGKRARRRKMEAISSGNDSFLLYIH